MTNQQTSGFAAHAAIIGLWARRYIADGLIEGARNIVANHKGYPWVEVLTPEERAAVGLGEVA